ALGARTVLAQCPQHDTDDSRAVAAASAARAALVVRARSPAGLPLALLKAWRAARRMGPVRWIPPGGAHPRAVVGHLLAGLELESQLPDLPDAIVTPLGTGGTAAGLGLAVAALSWPTRIVGVRVAPRLIANRWRTTRLARRAALLLARHGLRLPLPASRFPVAVRGEGAPLLFVHGFPFDHTMWRHQLGSLDGWRRIAPDLRGVRVSTPPRGGYTMARYADDLAAVLDALVIERATVCGQSLGGYIVFELLRRHPDRVGALVLVATKPDADTPEGQGARDQVVAQTEREGPAAVADGMLPRLLGRTTRATRPGVAEAVRQMAGGWS